MSKETYAPQFFLLDACVAGAERLRDLVISSMEISHEETVKGRLGNAYLAECQAVRFNETISLLWEKFYTHNPELRGEA